MKRVGKQEVIEMLFESIRLYKMASKSQIFSSELFLWNAFVNSDIDAFEIYDNIIDASSALGVVDKVKFFKDEYLDDTDKILLKYEDSLNGVPVSKTIILKPYYFFNDVISYVTIKELIDSVDEERNFESRFLMREANKINSKSQRKIGLTETMEDRDVPDFTTDFIKEMRNED
jgi:hypothetical protein